MQLAFFYSLALSLSALTAFSTKRADPCSLNFSKIEPVTVRPILSVSEAVDLRDGYPHLRNTFRSIDQIPEHFLDDLPYFLSLARDIGRSGATLSQLNVEAMAIIKAERIGLFKGPAYRSEDETIDFLDADLNPWDVKSPSPMPRGDRFVLNLELVGNSILRKVRRPFQGQQIRILLDVTFLRVEERKRLRRWLQSSLLEHEIDSVYEVFSL